MAEKKVSGGARSGPEYRIGGDKAKGFASVTPEQRSEWGRRGGLKRKEEFRNGQEKV